MTSKPSDAIENESNNLSGSSPYAGSPVTFSPNMSHSQSSQDDDEVLASSGMDSGNELNEEEEIFENGLDEDNMFIMEEDEVSSVDFFKVLWKLQAKMCLL